MTSAMLTRIKDFFMLPAELPTVVPLKYGKDCIVDFYIMSWIHVQSNTCTYLCYAHTSNLHCNFSVGLPVSTCGGLFRAKDSFNLSLPCMQLLFTLCSPSTNIRLKLPPLLHSGLSNYNIRSHELASYKL